MKGLKSVLLLAMLLVAVLLYAVPAFCEDEGLGELVSDAAPKGESKVIPPGHFAMVAKYADVFLTPVTGDPSRPGGFRTIYAADVAPKLDSYFVLDVRPVNEYLAGTVPGAINIPMNDLAKAENLAKLPLDKAILIVCNTGHTASISTTVLGMLGYDVWTLRFGMMGWRALTKAKVWSPKVSQDIYGAGYVSKIGQ